MASLEHSFYRNTYRNCSDDIINSNFLIEGEVVWTFIEHWFVIVYVDQFNFYKGESWQLLASFGFIG